MASENKVTPPMGVASSKDWLVWYRDLTLLSQLGQLLFYSLPYSPRAWPQEHALVNALDAKFSCLRVCFLRSICNISLLHHHSPATQSVTQCWSKIVFMNESMNKWGAVLPNLGFLIVKVGWCDRYHGVPVRMTRQYTWCTN
jgi:hypothetical protein